jgi:hypothetical protein
MATQIVTFPSDSGTEITPQRPDVRLVIPNDGAVYDLSQSRVRITLETSGQSSPLYDGLNVIDRRLRFNGAIANNFPLGRESFIRHVKISDQRHGVVDLRRYNNNLMTTLNEYQRSRTEKINSGVFDTYAGNIFNSESGGFFMQKNVYGNIPSVARPGVLDVPLSDLTDLARVNESRLWPTSLTGETVIELEMEPYTSFRATAVGRSAAAAIPAAQRRVALICTDANGARPAAGTTVYMTEQEIDYDACPFYVGMPITRNYGAPAVSDTTSIRSITRPPPMGGNGRRLLIQVATAQTTAATTDLNLQPYAYDSANNAINIPDPAIAFQYVRVELQMVRVMSGGIPASISYMSYRLRDLATSNQTEYTTTLQVPSDRTTNMMVLWKDFNTMQSTNQNALAYRFSINDEYEAPSISFRTSQHQEMIIRGFRNAGMILRDLNEVLPNAQIINTYNADDATSTIKMIMAPLPIRPPGEPDTVVQLEILYAGEDERRLLVYAQQISTLQLSNVGVESGTGPGF